MKKYRVLTSILLVAFLLMGSSYAAWSDTLILDHNVTTGTLDVDWQPDADYTFSGLSNYYSPSIPVDPSCTMDIAYPIDETETLSVTINNMYPGVQAYYFFWQQNMGTLPAKFESASVDLSGSDPGALSNIIYSINLFLYQNDTNTYQWINGYYGPVTGVETFINSNLAGKILDPGDSITTNGDMEGQLSFFLLPNTAENDSQGQFLNFDITFTWVQP